MQAVRVGFCRCHVTRRRPLAPTVELTARSPAPTWPPFSPPPNPAALTSLLPPWRPPTSSTSRMSCTAAASASKCSAPTTAQVGGQAGGRGGKRVAARRKDARCTYRQWVQCSLAAVHRTQPTCSPLHFPTLPPPASPAGVCKTDSAGKPLSIAVMISDECPECGSDHIDVQSLAFAKVGETGYEVWGGAGERDGCSTWMRAVGQPGGWARRLYQCRRPPSASSLSPATLLPSTLHRWLNRHRAPQGAPHS